jgi:hypothetical protein
MINAWVARRGPRNGQDYELQAHRACWRTFAETLTPEMWNAVAAKPVPEEVRSRAAEPSLEASFTGNDAVKSFDAERLTAFTRTYGPLTEPAGREQFFSPQLIFVAVDLVLVARGWDDNPEHSICRFGADNTAKPDESVRLESESMWFRMQNNARLNSGTLLSMLLFWATAHAYQRVAMRRCAACNNWLILSRTDRIFCDNACRMQAKVGRGQRGRRRGTTPNKHRPEAS